MLKAQTETGIPVLDFAEGNFIVPELRKLLVNRGVSYSRDDKKIGTKWNHLNGEAKACFRNATQAALDHPDELTYVEGFAFANRGWFPMEHAWVIDKNGNVIDKTWPEGFDYYGIPFPADQLRQIILNSECYGILCNAWCNEDIRELLGLRF